MRLKLHIWVFFKTTSFKGLNVILHTLFCKESSKGSRLIQQVWPNLASTWFSDHKCVTHSIFSILNWLFFLCILIIIYNNFFLHVKIHLCFESHQKLKGVTSHFGTLWVRLGWLLKTIYCSFFDILSWFQNHDSLFRLLNNFSSRI